MISRRRGGFDVLISGFERAVAFDVLVAGVLVLDVFPVVEALEVFFFLFV